MNHQDFFERVNEVYRKARTLTFEDGGYSNLSRGMAHTVSSQIEDLFGRYVAELLGRRDIHLIIDKPMFVPANRTKFQPDLVIEKEGKMTHYFDVKTNLGWQRDLLPYLDRKNTLVKGLRGANARFRDTEKNVTPVIVSEKLQYQLVVIDGGNINQGLLKEHLKHAAELECVEMYVLFGEENIGGNTQGHRMIREQDFSRLDSDINALWP